MKLEFKKGQRIRVSVIELQTGNDLLVSFQGNLMLVHNDSGKKFAVNDQMILIVASINPLILKFESKSSLDVSV
ncbi:MAG: hypothetical protein LW875_01370 [Proteobacteria bacterium]|jgi:hypothetical protein|nr:hypothetical protein [Pseudomonadota bacterium]